METDPQWRLFFVVAIDCNGGMMVFYPGGGKNEETLVRHNLGE